MMRTSAQENGTPWDVLQSNEAALNAMVRARRGPAACLVVGGRAKGYTLLLVRASQAVLQQRALAGGGPESQAHCNARVRALQLRQIAYAESTGECRRSMLMHHFGERTFGPEQCARTCDVCQALAAGGKQARARAASRCLPACY